MMLEYYFSSCDYMEDFEALVDAHEFFYWVPEFEYDVWFKAYDTSCHENEREIELEKQGYKYDCYVSVSEFGMTGNDVLYNKPARSREEAEKILNDFATCFKSNDKAIKKLKKLVG